PEQGVGAILLTNADNGGMLLRSFRRRFAEVVFDGKLEAADDVAAQAKSYAAEVAKNRERLVVPADPAEAAKLAARYTSKELGEIVVKKVGAATVFDFGEFTSPVASRKNDDGTITFLTIEPSVDGFELVVGARAGKRTLVVRDAQHEYVFIEAG
ncbi:MAG: serine hydrolase, partial [Byssovorax sp.]